MRISCIIPSRNRCHLLPKALDSVLLQNRPHPEVSFPPEIIVADDGSTDATLPMLREAYPEVRIIKTGGVGPGRARNQAVAAAGGEILLFLDSDDTWRPDHLRLLADCFRNGATIACGITANEDMVTGSRFTIPDSGVSLSGDVFSTIVRWCEMVPSAVGITKEAFTKLGGFPPDMWGEDWLFFLRATACHPVCFVPEVITDRLLHTGSLCAEAAIQHRISTMLDAVSRLFSTLDRAGEKEKEHIARLKQFVIEKGEQWKTIQEFYTAAKEKRLLAP